MKYILTDETLIYKGKTLRRIKRLFDNLLGGFLESESNLSHDGSCFVYDNAKAMDQARVLGNAGICNNSEVFDNAMIGDDSEVLGFATVGGLSNILGKSIVSGFSRINGSVTIIDSYIYDYSDVKENSSLKNAHITGNSRVMGSAQIENSSITGSAKVSENAVLKNSSLCCDSIVSGDAIVENTVVPKGSTITTSINNFKSTAPLKIKSPDDFFVTTWQGVKFTFFDGGLGIDCKTMSDADQGVVPWSQSDADERFSSVDVYKAIIDPNNMTAMPEINMGKNAKWFICSLVKFSEILTMSELDALSAHFSFGLPAIIDYSGRLQLWSFLKNKELTDATIWSECRVKILELLNARI